VGWSGWAPAQGAGGGGASDFLTLSDTPASYVGQGLLHVRVNLAETGLEFIGAGDVSTTSIFELIDTDDDSTTEVWAVEHNSPTAGVGPRLLTMSESGELLVGVVGVGGGTLSVPGSAVGSEQFGAGAAATGAGSIALGTNSVADAADCVVVGDSADSGGSPRNTIVGDGASATGSVIGRNVVVGDGAIVVGGTEGKSVCIGSGASAVERNVVIGLGAVGLSTQVIVIGKQASTDALSSNSVVIGAVAVNSGGSNVVLGVGTTTTGGNAVSVGAGATATTSGTALGVNSTAAQQATALGGGASATQLGSVAVGLSSTADLDCVVIGHLSTSNGASDCTIIGDGASVVSGASNNAVCVGSGASGESNSVQIGSQTTGTGSGSTFVGFNITGGTSGNAVIIGANSTSNNAANLVAVGEGISGADSCVLIGRATSTAGAGTTALGNGANDTAVSGFGVAVGYLAQSAGGVALGAQATSAGSLSTALGRQASCTGAGNGGVVIGANASDAGFNTCIVLGSSATATKSNQMVVGSNGGFVTEVVIGEGAASASPSSQLLFTTTNGSGVSIHATDLVLQSGLSTGTGAATDIVFKTPDVGLVSDATLQTAVTRLTLNEAASAFTNPVELATFTVATLPSASTAARIIYVSDETGGAVPAFSDGTDWRRMTDRAIVA